MTREYKTLRAIEAETERLGLPRSAFNAILDFHENTKNLDWENNFFVPAKALLPTMLEYLQSVATTEHPALIRRMFSSKFAGVDEFSCRMIGTIDDVIVIWNPLLESSTSFAKRVGETLREYGDADSYPPMDIIKLFLARSLGTQREWTTPETTDEI